MHLDEQINIELNGAMQFMSLRAEKKDAPLILYLHGGPGDAALPLMLKYNKELEKHFTVVIWEQRGAGKSYYNFGDAKISMQLFLQDIFTLTQYLLKRFKQKSLILVGHSWGSVLGLLFIQKHPELVKTYIGCGQVVNMKKSCQLAYDFAYTQALANKDQKALQRLKGIDCGYCAETWLSDLLFVTKQVVKHKGSLYGKTNYNDLVTPFLFSKYYSLVDLIRRQKGSLQAIKYLWQELMQTNFEDQTQFQVPVIFIEGRYDSHVSSALAKEYFDTITTEKQFYWFENACHFPQWSESERFNRLIIKIC